MATVVFDARDAYGLRPRGWARYARELVRELERLAPGRGIELWPVADGGPGPELLFEQLRLPLLLRRSHAAAVHVPNCFLPLRRPCPGVVTVHDLAFEDHPDDFPRKTGAKYRGFAPRAARSAERVICPSEFTRDLVCERWRVDPARVRVIGEAPALPVGQDPPPEGPYLLAVGDLRRKKNLRRLVEAHARLRAEGLPHRLVLAGLDSGEGAALGREGVELTGWVDDARLDALMRGADVLVHPSLHEGFGLVVLEGMARGVPVAAARASALPETGGDAAVYFDPRDVDDIAAVLRRTIEDGELRKGLAAAGRERVGGFTWQAAAERTLSVYLELVE